MYKRQTLGVEVPLLGTVPLEPAVRTGGDEGVPVVLTDTGASPAAQALEQVAARLAVRPRSLRGVGLPLSPR